jgi:hypothetical protein
MAQPTRSGPPPTAIHETYGPPPASNTSAYHRGIRPSRSSTFLAFPQSNTVHNLASGPAGQAHSSRTWTASSGDLGLLSDTDELEDRAAFLIEYNRLAKKVHKPLLTVLDEDHEQAIDAD